MNVPVFDEADLAAKLAATLQDFSRNFGGPPRSTSILFEPYNECWGIYHSSKQMGPDDSPGDYEIQNAEVGAIQAPESDYDQADFASVLRTIGERLFLSAGDHLRPETLGVELDYDRVATFPNEQRRKG